MHSRLMFLKKRRRVSLFVFFVLLEEVFFTDVSEVPLEYGDEKEQQQTCSSGFVKAKLIFNTNLHYFPGVAFCTNFPRCAFVSVDICAHGQASWQILCYWALKLWLQPQQPLFVCGGSPFPVPRGACSTKPPKGPYIPHLTMLLSA